MIYDDLEALEIGPSKAANIAFWLRSYTQVNMALQSCKTADEVLQLLKVELMTLARPSYISRIYGRYRKLLPTQDLEGIQEWRRRNGQTRK